jgi:hypothetical protein
VRPDFRRVAARDLLDCKSQALTRHESAQGATAWGFNSKERWCLVGIVGLILIVILLVYFILPAAGAGGGGGRYAPRYGWGGPSLISLLLIILVVCLIFRVVPVVWY